ncbi:Phosphoglucomutase [Nitrincola nitratireducens]|uniref:Phosphoglucomutase n=2 Tax=Nitrincola nitratireducens TaxID=1229521 RepID=W9UVU6_9GAMM|nr:Phosphoglucomutase [Nitrincola nitratireducens]
MSNMDIQALLNAYVNVIPNPTLADQRVAFGTSGHRGSALKASFNEHHILAICQAVADYRKEQGFSGPLYLGMDTHALSGPAHASALEVLVANGINVRVHPQNAFVPTPLVSRAIIVHNQHSPDALSDGLIITPSHNPPEDGGIKYNAADGGPAAAEVTRWIEQRANQYLEQNLLGVLRVDQAEAAAKAEAFDYVKYYIKDLEQVIDIESIKKANLTLGVDPMGGSALEVWQEIAKTFELNLSIVNEDQSPDFAFMPPDHDGKIRMDCSSTAAMANLLNIKDSFQLAFANDPDADRHGIVGPDGLMNPNHFLAVCIDYLLTHRPEWSKDVAIGKTLVSSSIIDKVVAGRGCSLYEVPVGFKWFVEGLFNGRLGFGGEESAGANFLTRRGQVWCTDKDGIIPSLLAAEILAVTGKTPHQYYEELTQAYGRPYYRRIDASASTEQKAVLSAMNPKSVTQSTLAGDEIVARYVEAPGNGASIGGLKVVTEAGWFAARPSGTEALYKIYAESFKSQAHLDTLLVEAQALVSKVFASQGV